MKRAFSLDTDPATSSWGTRPSARANEWDIDAQHAFGCLWDELKHSGNESGRWDVANKSFPCGISAQIMSLDQENPSKPIYIFAQPAHLTDNLQNLWHTLLTSTTASHHLWRYVQHSWPLFWVTSICYPPLTHWPMLRTEIVMWCLVVAMISHHWCKFNPVADTTSLRLGRQRWCWSQPMGTRNHGDLAGEGWLGNETER